MEKDQDDMHTFPELGNMHETAIVTRTASLGAIANGFQLPANLVPAGSAGQRCRGRRTVPSRTRPRRRHMEARWGLPCRTASTQIGDLTVCTIDL